MTHDEQSRFSVEILRYPTAEDWARCKILALNTIGKHIVDAPSEDWKRKILVAEHSPIRTLMFTIKMEIPYYVSVHFCRHKFGVEHYVSSQRNDRQSEYDREAARQDVLVTNIMDANAQALISMAKVRLCYNADPTTRAVMLAIKENVIKACPEFSDVLIPSCEYRNGCPEMKTCGYYALKVKNDTGRS